MASERWFDVRIHVTEENDGATYLRRGPEPRSETLTLEKALQSYSKDRIIRALEEALAEARKVR